MAIKIEVKFGEETAFATMGSSPDTVIWTGNQELIEDAEFSLNYSYGAAGHNYMSGNQTTALDVATALTHRYGSENINVIEGVEVLEKEEKELNKIEKTGQT